MARYKVVATLLGLLVVVLTGQPADAHASQHMMGGGARQCRSVSTLVSLAAGEAARYRLNADLCWRGSLAGKTLQVTIPGFTYGPEYWDFPYQPERYSYVRAAVAAGYATLDINRMLVPTPPAAAVTIPAQADMVRQLVNALRAGRIAGTKFCRIIGVGHSMGAAMLLIAAANYRGLDGLILADFLHEGNPQTSQRLAQYRGPAQLNWQFKKLPEGYLSTLPGTANRLASFYNPATVDPAVVAVDERTKKAGTTGEFQTFAVAREAVYSRAISVPILLVVGQKDSLMCDEASTGLSCATSTAVLKRERGYFRPGASLEAFVLPCAGHDTNLHFGADRWFATAVSWAHRHVGN